MGWRAQHAYDEAERQDWRQFMAAQTPSRRFMIRARQFLIVAGIAALFAGPFVAMIIRDLF